MFGNLEIHREYVHTTAEGRQLLVMHGDEFDTVVKCSPWLAQRGRAAYDFLLSMNRHVNAVRRLFGLPYWSLASYLKHKAKTAVQYIASFETRGGARGAQARRRRRRLRPHPSRRRCTDIDGVTYCNDGDWVESCTALVEDMNGRLSIWSWPEMREQVLARLWWKSRRDGLADLERGCRARGRAGLPGELSLGRARFARVPSREAAQVELSALRSQLLVNAGQR